MATYNGIPVDLQMRGMDEIWKQNALLPGFFGTMSPTQAQLLRQYGGFTSEALNNLMNYSRGQGGSGPQSWKDAWATGEAMTSASPLQQVTKAYELALKKGYRGEFKQFADQFLSPVGGLAGLNAKYTQWLNSPQRWQQDFQDYSRAQGTPSIYNPELLQNYRAARVQNEYGGRASPAMMNWMSGQGTFAGGRPGGTNTGGTNTGGGTPVGGNTNTQVTQQQPRYMDYTPGYLRNSMQFGSPQQRQNAVTAAETGNVANNSVVGEGSGTPASVSNNGINYPGGSATFDESAGTNQSAYTDMIQTPTTTGTATGVQTPTIQNSGLTQGTNQTLSPTLNTSRYPTMSNLFNFQRTR